MHHSPIYQVTYSGGYFNHQIAELNYYLHDNCHDRQSDHGFPIVALVENTGAEKDEDVRCYRLNGTTAEPSYNLMMLPEKKEGWVNVYKVTNGYESRSIFTTKEDAIKKVTGAGYVNTVKIQWEE